MLLELGKAFRRTISSSSEVSLAVRKIHQEGYTLRLVLDRKEKEDNDGQQLELAPRPTCEPSFRLDGKDVAFLKSLGIDATRPARKRR